MKPTRVTAGATFLSSSSDFPNITYSMKVKPVTFPPGRARLEMKPCPTGSLTNTKTIGIEGVTCTASERITLPFATMMSGGCPATSVTSPRMRPTSPAVQCQSMRRFFPSVQPGACKPSRKAAARAWPSGSSSALFISTAIRPIRSGCCARAVSGHAASALPSSVGKRSTLKSDFFSLAKTGRVLRRFCPGRADVVSCNLCPGGPGQFAFGGGHFRS